MESERRTETTASNSFGNGIYFTNSARYAADIDSSLAGADDQDNSSAHLVMAWVSMREPFPVLKQVRRLLLLPHYFAMIDKNTPVSRLKEVPHQEFLQALDIHSRQGYLGQAVLYVNLGRSLQTIQSVVNLPNGTKMTRQQLYLKAIEIDPKFSPAYNNLAAAVAAEAILQLPNGTYMTQQHLYLKAIDLSPHYSAAYNNLATTLADGASIRLPNGTIMTKQQLNLRANDLDGKRPQ